MFCGACLRMPCSTSCITSTTADETGHGLDRVAHRVRAELRPPLAPEVVGDLGAVDHREHRRQRGRAGGDPPVVLAGAEDVVPLALAALQAALHPAGLPEGHADL